MGWLTNGGWFLINAASTLYSAQTLMALVAITHPGFEVKAWQTYLVYCAVALLTLVINLPRVFKCIDWILKASLVLINGTALYLLISLLARAQPKRTAHAVFIEYVNLSGWDSDALVFFIAMLPALSTLAAFDSATHLTDELESPKKQVPQVIIGSFLMSFFTSVAMILVYQFCNTNPVGLLQPVGGSPLVQLLSDALQSEAMTVAGVVLILLSLLVAGIACLLSWSRLYWSFSREGSLPFSRSMSKLSSRDSLPVNALVLNTILIILIGTISIASTTAMNALLGGAGLCIIASLAAVFGAALYRGRKSFDPDRWLNLGHRSGDFVFMIALLWAIFCAVMISFPLYLPITAESMNYTSVVFVGFIVVSGIYYVMIFSKTRNGRRVD